MTEKFLTLHPEGKQGVNIDKKKYDLIRQAILDSLTQNGGEIYFKELAPAVTGNLSEPFSGSIGWYTISVKLDLEARGEIERIAGISPQKLRLVN